MGARSAGFVALAALAAAAWAVRWLVVHDETTAPLAADRDAALADEVKRLRRENAELREKLERRPRQRAATPPSTAAPAVPAQGGAARERTVSESGMILEKFVVSADEAPADPLDQTTVAELLDRLRAAVGASHAPEVKAIEFALARRGADAVDPLMNLVRETSEPDAVRDAALRALAVLRAPGLAALVENLYLSRRDAAADAPARRALALGAAVAADAEGALPLVQRLLWSPDAADRAAVFAALSGARDPAYLPLLRDHVMRPETGAAAVGLADTIARLRDKRWSALQATDTPDTPAEGDIGTSWASKEADMGEVWLELDFETAVAPESLRIRETYNPGAVARVEAVAADGTRETLWEGRASVETGPRWFEPPLRAASSRVRTVRLILDTNRVPGWNEIDAVELLGDGRRQWASAARASSSYSDP